MIFGIIITVISVEHSFFLVYAFMNIPPTIKGMDAINLFLKNNLRHVFDHVEYSFTLAIIFQVRLLNFNYLYIL